MRHGHGHGHEGQEEPRGGAPEGAVPTWALRAALSRGQDWLGTGQRRTATCQALYVAALRMDRQTEPSQVSAKWSPPLTHPLSSGSHTHQAATQAAGVSGVREVRSVGVLFPTKGTA